MAAPGGLMAKMAARGTLPSSAPPVSPMKAPRAGHDLLDASSPAVPRSAVASSPPPKLKPKAAEPETPPRTPGKKQQPCGNADGACVCGSVLMPDAKFCRMCGVKVVEGGKGSKAAGNGVKATLAAPGAPTASAMLPPKVPNAKAKAGKGKGKNCRRKGKFPEFPGLMLPASPEKSLELPRRGQLPRKREEDNYEMSDREESSDEIPHDLDRSGKHVPGWVEGFEDRAIKQGDVDPGSVFGRGVPACDLDDIFPDALYRKVNKVKVKRVRGSSCRWGPDRLKGSEIREYAQKMGQRRRLSLFQRASLACARPAKKMRGGA